MRPARLASTPDRREIPTMRPLPETGFEGRRTAERRARRASKRRLIKRETRMDKRLKKNIHKRRKPVTNPRGGKWKESRCKDHCGEAPKGLDEGGSAPAAPGRLSGRPGRPLLGKPGWASPEAPKGKAEGHQPAGEPAPRVRFPADETPVPGRKGRTGARASDPSVMPDSVPVFGARGRRPVVRGDRRAPGRRGGHGKGATPFLACGSTARLSSCPFRTRNGARPWLVSRRWCSPTREGSIPRSS